MSDTTNDVMCPTEDVLHEYVDERSELSSRERVAIDVHLDGCATCAEAVDELRRFRTLLLRTRVSGLDDEQWQVLDERVQMMGSEYVPPQSRFGRVYWGVAALAAVGLLAVGAWQLLKLDDGAARSGGDIADSGKIERGSIALRVGAVEGGLQVADAGGNWRALRAGEALHRGTRLRADKAAGSLAVPEHARLRLAPGSEAEVLVADGHSFFLRLRKGGEIGCQVDKRRPGQGFAIMAGRFRATVVGTEFIVRHGDKATVTVRVTEGAVRVDEAEAPRARISESRYVVKAGDQWHFASGKMEFGPIADQTLRAAPASRQRADEQAAQAAPTQPSGTPSPAPRARTTVRKARPAAGSANTRGRKIEIIIPPQRMPVEDVERLKALEKLIFDRGGRENRDADSTDTLPVP